MTDLIAGHYTNTHRPMPMPTPDGCHWCGIARPHGWQHIEPAGLHQWAQPTPEQRLARMLSRRADRQEQK